jgi:hypothetical protein
MALPKGMASEEPARERMTAEDFIVIVVCRSLEETESKCCNGRMAQPSECKYRWGMRENVEGQRRTGERRSR